ncbi:hypothetical protein ACFVRT_15905 [Arthrobacter koreensis]|uniref:hypothetical protein n=1 Tax=Arthrobacter koreensis TaxID=199136 RepID=UPI0036DEB407
MTRMVRLTEITGLPWYYDAADLQSRSAEFAAVPSDPDDIEVLLQENPDQEWGSTASAFSTLLSTGPGIDAPIPAQIHIASGPPLDAWNRKNLDLSDDSRSEPSPMPLPCSPTGAPLAAGPRTAGNQGPVCDHQVLVLGVQVRER